MDDETRKVLAMALGAAAAVIESYVPGQPPKRVSAREERMRAILAGVRRINDDEGRGVTKAEMAAIAEEAGVGFQGTAGWFSAGFLEKNFDEGGDPGGYRWITPEGRARLDALQGV